MRGGPLELIDQIPVVAGLLGLVALELIEQELDPVDGRKDQADSLAGDRGAVPEIADQRFRGMRERFQPRQVEEAAGMQNSAGTQDSWEEDTARLHHNQN